MDDDLYINNLREMVVSIGVKIAITEQKIGFDEMNGGFKKRDAHSLLILDALWDSVFPLYFKELVSQNEG